MSVSNDLQDLRTALDTATDAIAKRLDALLAKITNSMTDAEVAAVKAGFQADIDRLSAMGKDSADPVPTV